MENSEFYLKKFIWVELSEVYWSEAGAGVYSGRGFEGTF